MRPVRPDKEDFMKDLFSGIAMLALAVGLVVGIIFGGVAIWSLLRVYNATSIGKAELARADQNRQILITQAKAEKEAAELRAEAIHVMGKAAKDFPEYRQQEFMAAFGEALREGNISQIIYVPTEANIPVLEASRLRPAAQ